MRTLIKQGHKGALALFGNAQKPKIQLNNIRWDKNICLGKRASFSGEILSIGNKPQQLLLDYRVHFCKKNGKQNPKTFKWKKITLDPGKTIPISIQYHFRDLTTRKHYPGPHAWQLMINGELFLIYPFDVMDS